MANTTSINNELYANLVMEAQMAAYENSVVRQIATVFDAPLNAGKVLQVPVWAGMSAAGLTEGTAATAANTNTTSVSITLAEIGVYHQITDLLRDSAYSDVAAQIGAASGMAIAEKMDTDAWALFSSFTGEAGPGAGGELTAAHIMKAAAVLKGRKVSGPLFAVVRPEQAYALKSALTATTAYTANTNAGNRALDGYFVGMIGGVTVLESALIAVDGNDDAVGAVFSPAGLGHAMRGTLSYEATRQAQNRATDLMVTAVTGQAILQADFGIKLTADAVA
jgi:N4-gp56 family major capsid protein